MKIGLIDVDGHNYPNLALMKLSAYHKANGDSVEWYQPMFSGHLDRVYMSKVFSFTDDYPYFIDADEVIGGVLDMKSKLLMVGKYLINAMQRHCQMKLNIYIPTIHFMELQTLHMGLCLEDAPEVATFVTLQLKKGKYHIRLQT